MNPQVEFARFLRTERGLVACDEVDHYGCRADVLALDTKKKQIIEYEFKDNPRDLKYSELKKSKYKIQRRAFRGCYGHVLSNDKYINKSLSVYKNPQVPHRFYFVVPRELWEKEQDYLKKQNCGVIEYFHHIYKERQFHVVKKCIAKKTNLQKYDVAVKNMLNRLANVYVYLRH